VEEFKFKKRQYDVYLLIQEDENSFVDNALMVENQTAIKT
jgi:hypothetical protein